MLRRSHQHHSNKATQRASDTLQQSIFCSEGFSFLYEVTVLVLKTEVFYFVFQYSSLGALLR